MRQLQPVYIDGAWRRSESIGSLRAHDPRTGEEVGPAYPISGWADLEQIRAGAAAAADVLAELPPERIAAFLRRFADAMDARADEIAARAERETGLPAAARFLAVEIPRTTGQLRQAATAAQARSWTHPTIDHASEIRSIFRPLGGAVACLGPSNFPIAFNGVSGGDMAAAIATGNPVIAKGHPLHPATTQLLADVAHQAIVEAGLPSGTLQMFYHCAPEDGVRLLTDAAIGAVAYTGSQENGLALKAQLDSAGKLSYFELGSLNPVFVLPGALEERAEEIAAEFAAAALMGCGQFCTKPGLLVLSAGEGAEIFTRACKKAFAQAEPGWLLSEGIVRGLTTAIAAYRAAGADCLTGGAPRTGPGYRFENTLMKVSDEALLTYPHAFLREAFGNAALLVVAESAAAMLRIARQLPGQLSGAIYSARSGADDAIATRLTRTLEPRVGRVLNDKMPPGLAVVPAMVHGGPYPATTHPGFTAVGIPASLRRFAALRCYDNVRPERLPPELRDPCPMPGLWRLVDGAWTLEVTRKG